MSAHEYDYDFGILNDENSTQDENIAKGIVGYLENEGRLEGFTATRDAIPGQDIFKSVDTIAEKCKYSLILLSKAFLANKNWNSYCRQIVQFSKIQAGKADHVIPILYGIDHKDLPTELKMIRPIRWDVDRAEECCQRILKALLKGTKKNVIEKSINKKNEPVLKKIVPSITTVKGPWESDTHSLVADYVGYQLRKRGFEFDNNKVTNPTQATQMMRKLGDKFQERYGEVFEEMTNQLHVTPSTSHSTFTAIADELFQDGVKWGRVVALVAFSGSFAVKCVELGLPKLVDEIREWTSKYINKNLAEWMNKNEGWDGLLQHYGIDDTDGRHTVPDIKSILSFGVGAIGVITLGALLAQRPDT
ncbi:unnamed protein product [Owenia fusiformis]|uniref:Uncharacterized protein n=1 Tax=Owenia fusiformis TaxID=6347 RepID=A0A8J1UBU7_OWEFU|nr:unnamed protein product [Owenia fusiformis]